MQAKKPFVSTTYGPVSLALCHKQGEDDPWFICTNQQEADYLAIRTYSRRMWIEQLFADLEDGGLSPEP